MGKKNIWRSENFFIGIYLLLAILFLGLSLASNPWSNRLLGHDASMFMYFGEGMKHGLVPYTDMLDHKGPVLFFINYFAAILSNGSNFSLWIVELIALGITLLFTYKTCKIVSNKYASVVSVFISLGLYVITLELGNLGEEYSLPVIAIASYYFFMYICRKEKFKNVYFMIISFSAIWVFFIRANMVGLWIVIYIYIFATTLFNNHKKELYPFIGYSILGSFILIFPIILYCLKTNSLYEMISQVFLMNFQYAGSSLLEKWNVTLDFYSVISAFGYPFCIFLFCFVFLKYRKDKNKERNKVFLLIMAINLVNWYTIVLSGRPYKHYLMTQVIFLTILCSITIKELTKISNWKGTLVLILFFSLVFSPTLYLVKNNMQQTNFALHPVDNEQKVISSYIKNHTTQDDNIYVHNIDANIYLQSHRFSNSRFFVLPSLNYNFYPDISSEFLNSFTEKMPKYIVIRADIFDNKDFRFNNKILSLISENGNLVFKTNNFLLYEMDTN